MRREQYATQNHEHGSQEVLCTQDFQMRNHVDFQVRNRIRLGRKKAAVEMWVLSRDT